MAIHPWELQKAVYAALEAAGITDDAGDPIKGIYDDVPEDSAYPYIVVGEETANNVSTKTVDAHEHTLTLHVWSTYRGRKEIKVIMGQVYDALHDSDITVSGASLVNLKQEFERTLMEGDGITRHGVIRFRAVVFDN